MYNYTLKYRTFDELLSDVQVDFQNLSLQNMIEPQQLIKIAKKVNYDLGLRINKTKERLLEVEKNRVKLPDDFYTLNFALICDEVSVTQGMPQGTWIEDRPLITPYKTTSTTIDVCAAPIVNCQSCNTAPCGCSTSATTCGCNQPTCNRCFTTPLPNSADSYCFKPRIELNCKGEAFELVQVVNPGTTRTYRRMLPIRILSNPQSIECDCPNLYWNTAASAWIRDGYLYTTFDCATIYINYQGMLDDEFGNLLVPNHDMLNEYYEYSIKQRILENLLMNDDPTAQVKLQVVEARLRVARNAALSIVNTPNWSEMKQVWEMNRRAQYSKYYDMFKSYSWPNPNMATSGGQFGPSTNINSR
jgi:hypothetical protein